MVGDRVPIRIAIFAFSFLQSIAITVLLFAETLPLFFLFAILMGIGFGGRTPLTTSIRGVYFGRSSFARITGISMIPMNIMFIVVVPYIAWMRDSVTGNLYAAVRHYRCRERDWFVHVPGAGQPATLAFAAPAG